jgi:hypothetical protein
VYFRCGLVWWQHDDENVEIRSLFGRRFVPEREFSVIAFARRPGDAANLNCVLLLAARGTPVPIPARVGIQLARVLVVDRPEVRVLKPDDVDLDVWDPW